MRLIRTSIGSAAAIAFAVGVTLSVPARAQDPSGQDHEAHHPGGAAAQSSPAPAPAQPPPREGMPGVPGGQGMPGMMGGDMGRMMQMMQRMMASHGMIGGSSTMRPLQRIEGQLAYYQTELRIAEAQTPQWNAFADAIRAAAEKLRPIHPWAMQTTAEQSATAPTQLERRIATLSVLLETTRAIAAAMRPLYTALSEEQKRTADELLGEHLLDMRMPRR